MPNRKPKTNAQIVAAVMNTSRAGPLAEIFIVEAIRKYAEQVAANPDRVREAMDNGFISADAWIRTAEIVGQELAEAYGEKSYG